uniref:SUF system FeS cluster assembly SufBD core domain-containing protein n=1 Tax=Pseudo-nitzschia delicatissima TaxID=44447 RepID=A0A7S0UG52_9STRA|mmetsp:Transcript_2976/g.6179  ORF Transcript_2976/g.6179 Transcript_2976/m.6179 type:complete len:681 (+) Transcript_2976:86-2128(+)|eukprot:CAMPEP_0197262448 /NCGR_PEP_ID=MMETSP1432-20130617/503_1 /TAXON_ID=44447 /ORGANISM="Pseudo-nitzschia delicatissima, Strain UNC1205" /LENGTH=680 /DNA_ID=CAMNT_0042726749 /DNA_START=76 /DNA_END=2118 /DNA_ORIENTATION=-
MRTTTYEKVLSLGYLSLLSSHLQSTSAFTPNNVSPTPIKTVTSSSTSLGVSIGLGPDEAVEQEEEGKKELVAGVDYEVPDHEAFRTSRRSKLDEQCDQWFGALLGDEKDHGVLGSLADDVRKILTTPVELVNEVALPTDHEEWTPYVSTKLPWTPLTPAFGLEEFGLPTPRRNAETWRHFDVAGMVGQDYSGTNEKNGIVLDLTDDEVASYKSKLEQGGSWIAEDACQARLVYINGRYVPQLSMENDLARNLGEIDDSVSDEVKSYLSRLTDGFTDELPVPVPIGEDMYCSSYKKLGGADHALGEATSQFAINTQQGTACFAALNTRRTGGVAYVQVPDGHDNDVEERKPILILNAVTKNGGSASDSDGMTFHPRALVVAGKDSRLSVVQACVDLDDGSEYVPKLYNGFTQIMVKEGANVTHSFLEESGGMVTAGVEKTNEDFGEDEPIARDVEAERSELKDTHLECVDVQCIGDDASYEGTIMSVGGSGRIRIAHSVSLLKPLSHAKVYGFFLSGGAQRHDCKTNIHHAGQGTTSEQIQKNMIGGRATGAFRGRIRVDQSAQQTDSQQISRTILLSDKSRAWSVPSLEIIADDVQCTHGSTVSDLSEEELFYLRSRGLDTNLARNLLMYAFAADVCGSVDPAMLTSVDSDKGLQKRLIERLNNVVPQGERAVKGEFQSV